MVGIGGGRGCIFKVVRLGVARVGWSIEKGKEEARKKVSEVIQGTGIMEKEEEARQK